jgi:hypothetical protein
VGRLSARRGAIKSSFAQQKYSFSVLVCTGVLGSEVGFGCFGWVLRLFLSPVLGHVLECLGLICSFCGVWEGASLGSSPILPPSCLCHPVKMPHCRLDCLIPLSVWDRWCLAVCKALRI